MKTNPWAVALLIAVALGLQLILFQHQQIAVLNQELRLAQKAKEIEQDQSQDLACQLAQARIENSTLATKYFVAGVVEAVSKPDHYSEIWHAGYDRGSQAQEMYTSSKD